MKVFNYMCSFYNEIEIYVSENSTTKFNNLFYLIYLKQKIYYYFNLR